MGVLAGEALEVVEDVRARIRRRGRDVGVLEDELADLGEEDGVAVGREGALAGSEEGLDGAEPGGHGGEMI